MEEFAKVFFKPKKMQTPNDHAQMHRLLDFPVERFGSLEPEKQELFRNQLTAFRSLYAFLSQIIPFQDSDLEKLYSFIRLLIPRLPKRSIGPGVVFDDEVNLKYYRLQKTSEGSISLAPGDRGAVKAPTAVGTGEDHHEQIELSRLIDIVNQRFGTEFKPADQLFFDQIREEAVADTHIQQAAMVNSLENFKYVFDKALEGKFIDRMDRFSGGARLGKRPLVPRLWRQQYRKPLVFKIGESQQRLLLDPFVLNHFAEHQQRDADSLEAGGQLFANFSDHQITISRATGPRPADRRSRYLYLPNRREEQREIDELHRQGLHFVGDWHTHPEAVPTPSPSDIRTINQAVAKSRHHLYGFLMIVVGNGDFPISLHVSLNTSVSHLRLLPAP